MFTFINTTVGGMPRHIPKEIVMQQRFCTCGHQLWVLYSSIERKFRTLFFAGTCFSGKRVDICPCCGAPLDINRLS